MAQLSSKLMHFRYEKPCYCRKEKSLGLLCSNFLSLYDRDGVETIGLEDACERLGVTKRRLYEILVILESIGLLKKKAMNQYSWKGLGVIPKILKLLKEEGPRESYTLFEDDNVLSHVLDDDKGDNLCSSNGSNENENSNGSSVSKLSGSKSVKSDNRKRQCLRLLTQNFVKLFLRSESEIISIDEAAKILLEDAHDPSMTENNSTAKIRRLYDIANVLSSMDLIEKTYHPQTKRSVYRWIGMREKPQMATINDPTVLATKRRTLATELTNTSIKRRMGDPSSNATTDQTIVAPSQTQLECRSAPKLIDESDLAKGSIQNMKKFQFGPFAPISVPQDKPEGNNNGTQIRDWESIALTYRPQYQNQALGELFGHYMGAWNSYYSKITGRNPFMF